MPAIGGLAGCRTFEGTLQMRSKGTTLYQNPAIDGMGALVGPEREAVSSITTRHAVAGYAAAITLQGAAMDLRGTSITVDPIGIGDVGSLTKVDDVWVNAVQARVTAALGVTGGVDDHIVILQWSLLAPLNYGDAP